MIAGTALAAWLADRGAQKRSHDAVEKCARHWSRQPLMTEVERRLAELPEKTPEAVLDIARAFMDRTEDMDALMDDVLSSSAGDPFFRPPFHPLSSDIHNGLLLFHNPDLSLALGVTSVDMLAAKAAEPGGASSINFSGITTLFRYLKAGDATISFWEAPPITGDFVAAEAGKARFVDRRRISDGDEVLIDGRYQSFHIEHAAGDMLYFQAMVRPGAAPLAAEYDSKTLAFIGASSTDEVSSRVQMMVSLLRTMERDDALPLIVEALESPHFYTRWHIMRELLAMDADAALPHLRRMAAADPHPEVRATAAQTLQLFFADEDAPAAQGDVQCRA
jgi:HEAT repeats